MQSTKQTIFPNIKQLCFISALILLAGCATVNDFTHQVSSTYLGTEIVGRDGRESVINLTRPHSRQITRMQQQKDRLGEESEQDRGRPSQTYPVNFRWPLLHELGWREFEASIPAFGETGSVIEIQYQQLNRIKVNRKYQRRLAHRNNRSRIRSFIQSYPAFIGYEFTSSPQTRRNEAIRYTVLQLENLPGEISTYAAELDDQGRFIIQLSPFFRMMDDHGFENLDFIVHAPDTGTSTTIRVHREVFTEINSRMIFE